MNSINFPAHGLDRLTPASGEAVDQHRDTGTLSGSSENDQWFDHTTDIRADMPGSVKSVGAGVDSHVRIILSHLCGSAAE